MSKVLAPKKEKRIPYPDQWARRITTLETWSKSYDERQFLIKHPEQRVKVICKKWQDSDRKVACTVDYIVSETRQEKPLTEPFVEELMLGWQESEVAIVGGEPLRFIAFVR